MPVLSVWSNGHLYPGFLDPGCFVPESSCLYTGLSNQHCTLHAVAINSTSLMFPQCALNVPWMCTECSLNLNVPLMLTGCSVNVHWIWLFAKFDCSLTLIVHWIRLFTECSLNVHWMFTECSLNVHWVFTERSLNVHWTFPGHVDWNFSRKEKMMERQITFEKFKREVCWQGWSETATS
jgi:hypothetical protein